MGLYHIVSFADGQQRIYEDYQIKDGKAPIRQYGLDSDGYDTSWLEYYPIEIDRSVMVEINAAFVINPHDKDRSPMYCSGGFMQVNRLAYTYSIVILDYVGSTAYEHAVIYKECGIAATRRDMYSYHHFDENNKIVYDGTKLVYEVEDNLDLYKILLPDQE